MEAKDTVMNANDLCRLVCSEHRSATLEGKNCDGLDCEVCQLTKQAEISFKAGIKLVVEWIQEHSASEASYTDDLHMTRSWLELPHSLWQAKLKEWGLE